MTARSFDAGNAECLVFTEKAGLLSAVAHDLKLRVERFEVRVEADGVQGSFDAGSLRVVCARSDRRDLPDALSARDRAEIESNIAAKVLDARRHPAILFQSRSLAEQEGGWRAEGTLSIRGRARPLVVVARREGDRAVSESVLHQPDFGIQPYSALLGTLRIKPDVTVRLSLPWSAG